MTATSLHPCAIHQSHGPKHLTTESHHIIPRAWQGVWHPEDDARVLWAPKTVELCPTGHRNVHQILQVIMHAFEAVTAFDGERERLDRAIENSNRDYGRLNEFKVAVSAPTLWIARGGSLNTLVFNKQYGFGAVVLSHGPVIPREGYKL